MRLAQGNPMTRSLAAILLFEGIVFVLAIPGMIWVSDVASAPALGAGLAATALAVAASATVRRPWGWWPAWLTQVAAVALGLLTPWMYGVGAMFVGLFVVSFVLGRRLEARAPGGAPPPDAG